MHALDTWKNVSAATFHDQAGELVDVKQISNGSVRSHGLKSRTYEAAHTSNRPQGSGSLHSKCNTLSCGPSRTTDLHPPRLNQPGKCYSSAVGSSWADQPRTPLMPTAPSCWKNDWTFSGLKISLHYGHWFVLNVMLLSLIKHTRGQKPNKLKPERERKAER